MHLCNVSTCPASLILLRLITTLVLKSSWIHFLHLSFISSIFGSVLPLALNSYFNSCYFFRAKFVIFNPLSGPVKQIMSQISWLVHEHYVLHYMFYIIRSTLYVLHYMFYIIRSTLYVLHYMFYILCSTLYVLHYTFYIIRSTLYVLHYMFYIICSTLYVLHYMFYIICSTLYVLHYKFYIMRSTLYVLHPCIKKCLHYVSNKLRHTNKVCCIIQTKAHR
jgi:hypothetical protein